METETLDEREIDDPAVVAIADRIGTAIVKSLGSCVVAAALPAWFGEQIRETAKTGAYVWQYTVPMHGGMCFTIGVRLTPDGCLHLEFQDVCGAPFWRGTFRPEASDAHS